MFYFCSYNLFFLHIHFKTCVHIHVLAKYLIDNVLSYFYMLLSGLLAIQAAILGCLKTFSRTPSSLGKSLKLMVMPIKDGHSRPRATSRSARDICETEYKTCDYHIMALSP